MSGLFKIDLNQNFLDRKNTDFSTQPIEVMMLTLDAENFLDTCLYSIFKEIPINRLLVCDGGSKDKTLEILKKYPRVEVFIKPDIRTTGKAMEFLMSKIDTDWFVLIDSDIELEHGWFDEMRKHEDKLDVIENGKRTLAYHIFRDDEVKEKDEARALDLCHLIKKSSIKNFHCDDDYMWRFTDILCSLPTGQARIHHIVTWSVGTCTARGVIKIHSIRFVIT